MTFDDCHLYPDAHTEADHELTLPGRAQVTPEQAPPERATVEAGAQPRTATTRPPIASLDPTLPRPGSVSERFRDAIEGHERATTLHLRQPHTCIGMPICVRDIMERLRSRGVMLADFGSITTHDED